MEDHCDCTKHSSFVTEQGIFQQLGRVSFGDDQI